MTARQQKQRSFITIVLIIAVLLPIAGSIWFAHNSSNTKFHQELQIYATRVESRTQQVLRQANVVLQDLNTLKQTPCSPQHILAMRQLSYINLYIKEIIRMEGLTAQCSTRTSTRHALVFPEPDITTKNGYTFRYTSHNDLNIIYEMIGIGYQKYMVLIDPRSFIDTISYSRYDVNVALIGTINHRILASSKPFDIRAWQQARDKSANSLIMNGNRYIFMPVPSSLLVVVAWVPMAPLDKAWRQQLFIWVPSGILVSLLAAAFIWRILRRLQSPHYQLSEAIHSNVLEIHYQPIIKLNSGKMVGAEALVRWPQPDGTLLPPDVFIPLAEQTGLIEQLSQNVVEKVFEQMGEWLRRHPQIHIAINLAAEDLSSTQLLVRMNHLTERAGLAPGQIAIELTERSFARTDVIAPILTRYRQAGYPVCIDDFGTGYSSLSYLQELDADILKIDKTFVRALGHKQVTTHIIKIAHTLKLEMIAEGIETLGQEIWLKQHGVQYGQGWLYSKALPHDAFITWAEENLSQ